MKVLQVCPYDPDRHGGVQRHIHDLSGALSERGHEVLILAPGSSALARPGLLRIGCMRSVRFAGTRFEVTWAGADDIAHLIAELDRWQPDVAHFHTLWDPLMPWQVFRRLSMPRVATFHDTPPAGLSGVLLRNLFKLLSRYLLHRLDGSVAVSTAPLRHLRPGHRSPRPVVLPPATDLSAFLTLERRPQAEPRILFIGRLEPRKGIHVLLDAVSLLARGRVALPPGLPPPRFVVAGDGDLRPAVLAARGELGGNWIEHLPAPSQEEQLRLLSEATLAVSPALYGESFGIVLAEALASGTPVIGAGNAGYRTVLTGQGASLLVEPGNAGALARRIAELLARPGEIEALSGWGRRHARQFDVRARVWEFEALYRNAIARRS